MPPHGYVGRNGLLLRLIVAALAAREVAWTANGLLILDLDAASVVDGFAVRASARLFQGSFGHRRILSRGETAGRSVEAREHSRRD